MNLIDYLIRCLNIDFWSGSDILDLAGKLFYSSMRKFEQIEKFYEIYGNERKGRI